VAIETATDPLPGPVSVRPTEERLTAEQIATWRAFLVGYSSVLRSLEQELGAAHGMPLVWYDVLVQLVEAPERQLRMSELADALLFSRSGITRLIDRLEREGLVVRAPCSSDARGVYTQLTEEGVARLRGATATHLGGVKRHFMDRFSAEDQVLLHRLMRQLAG
jgi:DNA-binding MarR family transcriptional regulator